MNRQERRRRGERGPRDQIAELFEAVEGQEIYGGCEYCEAYQTVTQIMPGGWSVGIHHDDWCPWWTKYRQREKSA